MKSLGDKLFLPLRFKKIHVMIIYYFLLFSHCLVLVMDTKVLNNGLIFDVMGEAHDGYFISAGVGTPLQTVILLIDSGSSNFAINVNGLTNYSFEYKKSETFRGTDTLLTVRYTKGSWSGFLATDNFIFCSDDPACALSLQFACITSSVDFFDDSADWTGILGLAYPSLTEPQNNIHPFLESLVDNGMPNIFSISLCGPIVRSNITSSAEGKLLIGNVNKDYYEGEIIFTPVIKEWYYEVLLVDLKVGDSNFNSSCTDLNNEYSIIDTGTSFLYFPEAIHDWIVSEIKQQVPFLAKKFSEDFWTQEEETCMYDISIYKSFPKIALSLYHTNNSSFSIVISPELYIIKSYNYTDYKPCLMFAIKPHKKGTVIGATVLKGFYVIFDRENKRIGFANSSCSENLYASLDLRSVVLEPQFADEKDLACRFSPPEENEAFAIFALVITIIIALPIFYLTLRWLYYSIIKLETRNFLL